MEDKLINTAGNGPGDQGGSFIICQNQEMLFSREPLSHVPNSIYGPPSAPSSMGQLVHLPIRRRVDFRGLRCGLQSMTSGTPVPPDAAEDRSRFWPSGWWKLMDVRVGVIPVPIYLVLLGVIAYFVHAGKIPTDISMMTAVIAVGAFTCAELGDRLPILRRIGGAAILCTVIPSFVVYYHWLPDLLIKPVVDFTKYTVFLYLYIACLIVGSILGMDRAVLIKCFLKIFIPISIGTVVATTIGVSVATACGLGFHQALFFVVIPIMAGGVGEGAIPLSIGYAQLLH